ncbi:MAG: TlpA family protein disulfide reductase [Flavisolibacter sp.]
MKHHYMLWLLTGFFSLAAKAQEKLKITPGFPERGQEITIRYNPSSSDAAIRDTSTNVEMVFTYSNLYELPSTIPLKKKGVYWETSFVLPRYATYATFYVQSGAQKDQAGQGRHFEIAVYDKGKRVKDGYLYEGYSLPAQRGRVAGLAAMQAALFAKELQQYPDNYEAKLRLLNYKMGATSSEAEKKQYRKKAEAIIAAKFYENPGNMGSLNRVTMGYLIIGENSRLDSIRKVVKQKYPNTQAGYELQIGDITDGRDTMTMIAQLEQLVKRENASNQKYLTDAHQALMKLYAAQKKEAKALYHLRRSGDDDSPYRPQTLKMQAEVLMGGGMGLDTAYQLAQQALALADKFPAGLIRYFPETGYLPAYVSPDKRAATTRKAKGNLLSLLALIELKRGHDKAAGGWMDSALHISADVETLSSAGTFYAATGLHEKAFQAYKNIMLLAPEDTVSLGKMKAQYNLWRNGLVGWKAQMDLLSEHWAKEMAARLKTEMIQVKAHDFLKNIVDLQGKPIAEEAIKNKIVIIDFWATWCVPCMQEMPYVQKAYEKHATAADVAFMIINSGAKNTLQDAQGWWGNKKYAFPVYYNTDEQIGDKFGFNFIPAVYIIDKKGYIRFKTIGFEGPSIQRKIEAAIALLKDEKVQP